MMIAVIRIALTRSSVKGLHLLAALFSLHHSLLEEHMYPQIQLHMSAGPLCYQPVLNLEHPFANLTSKPHTHRGTILNLGQ